MLTEEQKEKGNRAVVEFKAYLRRSGGAPAPATPATPRPTSLTRADRRHAGEGEELSETELLQNCPSSSSTPVTRRRPILIGNALFELLEWPAEKKTSSGRSQPDRHGRSTNSCASSRPTQLGNRMNDGRRRVPRQDDPGRHPASICASAPPTATRASSRSPTGSICREKPQPPSCLRPGPPHLCAGFSPGTARKAVSPSAALSGAVPGLCFWQGSRSAQAACGSGDSRNLPARVKLKRTIKMTIIPLHSFAAGKLGSRRRAGSPKLRSAVTGEPVAEIGAELDFCRHDGLRPRCRWHCAAQDDLP